MNNTLNMSHNGAKLADTYNQAREIDWARKEVEGATYQQLAALLRDLPGTNWTHIAQAENTGTDAQRYNRLSSLLECEGWTVWF